MGSQDVNSNVGGQPPMHVSTANLPKLDGSNYASWKEMVTIHAKIRKIHEALDSEDVDDMIDLQCRLLLLETMDEAHRAQVRACTNSKAIIERLELIYADRSAANIYRLLSEYFTYKKKSTDSVAGHIGKMDNMRRNLEDLDEKQSDRMYQVTLIASLPAEYQSILEIWELTHPDLRTNENLVSRIIKREEDIKKNDTALLVKRGTATNEHTGKNLFCWNCETRGHLMRECSKPIDEAKVSKNRQAFAERRAKQNTDGPTKGQIKTVLSLGDIRSDMKNKWIADSGASSHMANDKAMFKELKLFRSAKQVVVGNGDPIDILGSGEVELLNGNTAATLLNVSYVPALATNLLSLGAAAKQGATSVVDENTCKVMKNGVVLFTGHRQNDLYVMDVSVAKPEVACVVNEDTTFYHKALGHPSEERLKLSLQHHGLTEAAKGQVEKCGECHAGKANRVTHPAVGSAEKEKEVGARVHLDLGSFGMNKDNEYTYYLLCKDEASEYVFIYMLESKAETSKAILQLLIDFERGSGKVVKGMRTDNGSEFVNKAVECLLLKEKIYHETSAPYTPQQNGVIEREIQTINKIARTFLTESGLSIELAPEALKTAVYVKNRVATRKSAMSPYERFTGQKPYLGNLFIFGSEVQVVDTQRKHSKFEPRTINGYAVGYTNRRNTFRVFIPKLGRTIVSSDVIFAPHYNEKTTETPSSEENVAVVGSVNSGMNENQDETASEHTDWEWFDAARADGPLESTLRQPEVRVGANGKPYITSEALERFFEENRASNAQGNSSELERPPASVREATEFESALSGNGGDDTVRPQERDSNEQAPPVPERSTSLSRASNDTPSVALIGRHTTTEIPTSRKQALESSEKDKWLEAEAVEMQAHHSNGTWEVVDLPRDKEPVSCKWVYAVKTDSDGNPTRWKARLVARGFEQRAGIDYAETFAPVAKMGTIRLMLALSAIFDWSIAQFDVSTAFLYGHIEEEVYMHPPEGMHLPVGKTLKLIKALYGLRQAPRAWNGTINSALEALGFKATQSDACLYTDELMETFVLLYVDDGLIFSKQKSRCDAVIDKLGDDFSIKRLDAEYFLGIKIVKEEGQVCLSQRRYIADIIGRFEMQKQCGLHCPQLDMSSLYDDAYPETKAPFREAIGCLQYLANATRPDILFITNVLARFNSCPRQHHWKAVESIFRYLTKTAEYELTYTRMPISIDTFCDADLASDLRDRSSTTGAITLLAGAPVTFCSQKQTAIALSSTEAEYIAACEAGKDIIWLVQLLDELNISHPTPQLHIDNKSAISIIENTDTKKRTRHIDLKYHAIRKWHKDRKFKVKHIPTNVQPADMLTKPLNGVRLKQHAQRCGLMAKVSVVLVAVMACLSMCEGLRFQTADPVLWFDSEHRIGLGIQHLNIQYTIPDHCGIKQDRSNWSHLNATSTLFDKLEEACRGEHLKSLHPAFRKFSRTKLPKGSAKDKQRHKRFFWFAIFLVVFIVWKVTEYTISYAWPGSDHNRVNDLEKQHEQQQAAVSNLANGQGGTLDRLETANKRIHNATQGIKQLSETIPSAIMTGASMQMEIQSMTESFDALAYSVAKDRHLDSYHAYKVFKLEMLRGLRKDDIYVDSLWEDTDLNNTMHIDLFVFKESNDTKIYRIEALPHWVNVTTNPVLVEYSGPEHVLYNATSNCKRGIHVQGEKGDVFETCTEPDYTDPSLDSWCEMKQDKQDDTRQRYVTKTATGSFISCTYKNITVSGHTYQCPAQVFYLPITSEFECDGITHEVSSSSVRQGNENRGQYTSPHLTEPTDDDYNREIALIREIKELNDLRVPTGRLAIEKGTALLPLEACYWPLYLGSLAALITIGGCLRHFLLGNTLGQPNSINVTQGPGDHTNGRAIELAEREESRALDTIDNEQRTIRMALEELAHQLNQSHQLMGRLMLSSARAPAKIELYDSIDGDPAA